MKKILCAIAISAAALPAYASFNGFNANIGAAYYHTNFDTSAQNDSIAFQNDNTLNSNDVYLHLQLGYGHRFEHFYLGVNGFADIGKAQASSTLNNSLSSTSTLQGNETVTLRNVYGLLLKPGFLVSPRFLIYAVGGGVYGNEENSLPIIDTSTGAQVADSSVSGYEFGWLAGAGAEYSIRPNVTLNTEWSYMKFNTNSFDFNLVGAQSNNLDVNVNRVLLGLNYYF